MRLVKLFVTHEEQKERQDICKQCEHYVSKLALCNVCKCIITAKSRMADTDCPENKWRKL